MKYRVSQLTACRVCGATDSLTPFLELPDMPLTDDFLPEDKLGTEFLYPIRVYLCRRCGLAQTLHDVDVAEYYQEYQYSVAVSPFAQNFMRRLAQETWNRYDMKSGDAVIEVGSNDGVQLAYFKEHGARVFGFEPSAPLAESSRRRGVPVAERLFDASADEDIPTELLPVQVLLLTYTFDHLPDPMGFLDAVRRVLDPERGVLIIEVHDLAKIVERREYCLFAHEHAAYYTPATMQMALRRAGFELIDVEIVPEAERRGNSLLIAATLEGSAHARRAVPTIGPGALGEVETYTNFGDAVRRSLDGLRSFAESKRRAGVRLAGYGAGGRGVMTLAASARPGDYAYVCDKNKAFHGFFTPGAHVPVDSPARLLADPVEEVVVFSFGYFDEIKGELADYTARGGHLISLLELL